MTEAEWVAATKSDSVLEFLGLSASDRKLQLFAVACCRRIWPLLHASHSRPVVELVEKYADDSVEEHVFHLAVTNALAFTESEQGRLTEIGCSAAYTAASITESYPGERTAWRASRTADCVCNTCYWVAYQAASALGQREPYVLAEAGESEERAAQSDLLREIFGNPFRPVNIDPRWLTADVTDLARAIYEDKAFDRMPILADALMDAGCDNAEIIGHCRGEGPHVRGCWVVDLLLGKE